MEKERQKEKETCMLTVRDARRPLVSRSILKPPLKDKSLLRAVEDASVIFPLLCGRLVKFLSGARRMRWSARPLLRMSVRMKAECLGAASSLNLTPMSPSGVEITNVDMPPLAADDEAGDEESSARWRSQFTAIRRLASIGSVRWRGDERRGGTNPTCSSM